MGGFTGERFLGGLILMIPMLLLSSSSVSQVTTRQFDVGGKDGWVVKPSEDYNHWAQRNRFQVNDTLYFKYKKESDSVVVVKKKDYDLYNTNNPIKKMDNGDSMFKFDKSGLYYFISGNIDNCQNGQKLIVLVMTVRHQHPHVAAPSKSILPPPQNISFTAMNSSTPSSAEKSSSGRAGVGVGSVGVIVIMLITSMV